MKKIYLIMQKKETSSALEEIRDLGVIHVEHQEPLSGYQLSERREEVGVLTNVINILKTQGCECHLEQKETEDWTEIANLLLKKVSEIEHYKENIAKRQTQIDQWELWGDFNPQDIEVLEARGVYVRLFEKPVSQELEFPADVVFKSVAVSGKLELCMLISREEVKLCYEFISPPAMSLKDMKRLQEEEQDQIAKIEEYVKSYACYLDSFKKILKERQDVLNLEEVQQGMREIDELTLLKGFCPADACSSLQSMAREKRWGLLMEETTEEDRVPTLLRNPKWVNLINPLFKLIDILPGYKEVDVSLVFLIFFSIFFGILVGDAAYGTLFLLVTLIAHIKVGGRFKEKYLFYLMYVLSSCAILWGVLTGTFFGQAWLSHTVKPIIPWLADMANVQMLCFLIAAVHLTIAHVWRSVLRFPSLTFLSEIGWLVIVWTMYFAANMFVLNYDFPQFALVLLFSGITLIVFFTRPHKNPFMAIGPGLGALAMNFINSFTDVISYIRLFAVGLATVSVADAFNEMALGIGFNSIFSGLASALILLFGHVLNIILAGMGILVHGIRLNVLEFSGHLNLEWRGFKYEPFRRMGELTTSLKE